jgi:hypothetical protein
MKIIKKLQTMLTPHYLIIGHYSGKVIGCCRGKSGKMDVLEEEPLSTFKRVSRRKCPVCKEFGLIR